MDPAPIALFTYRRLSHTRQTVEALLKNELASQSDLYVFLDGPKTATDAVAVDAVNRYIQGLTGFRSITLTKRSRNVGLSTSIIEGVTDVTNRRGRVIVVEDDIVTSPYFLRYMNDALKTYEHEPALISIHGYVYPHRARLPETFFLKGADCWGWATWERGWSHFNPDARKLLEELDRRGLTKEFDFKYYPYTAMLREQARGWNDSWAIRWYASAFVLGKLTLYPGRSLVRNIGLDGSGTHSRSTMGSLNAPMATAPVVVRRLPLVEDIAARREFERFFIKLRIERTLAGGWNLIRHPRRAAGSIRRITQRTPDRSSDS
jgi:hypothetical protein